MAVKAIRLAFHLFPDYHMVCTHCAMLLVVEKAKDLIVNEVLVGKESVRKPQVRCPHCENLVFLPPRDSDVAVMLYDMVPKDDLFRYKITD